MRPFRHDDEPTIARIAREEAIRDDRGDAVLGAMVSYLRQALSPYRPPHSSSGLPAQLARKPAGEPTMAVLS
ncbi:hypothetical protein [Bradyrhizobium sp. 5.13L]